MAEQNQRERISTGGPAVSCRQVTVRWTLGYWACVYVVFTFRSITLPYDMLLEQGLLRLIMMAVGLSLCALLFLMLERFELKEIPRRLPPIAAAAGAATAGYVTTNYFVFYVLAGIWEPNGEPVGIIVRYAVEFFWLFVAWIGIYYFLRMKREAAQPAAGSHAQALWIRDRGTAVRVAFEEIQWVESEGDYVRVHVVGRSYLMRATMRNMEEVLDAAGFIRIHRSVIAPIRLICAFERRADSSVQLRLSTGVTLPVGRHYLPRLRKSDGLSLTLIGRGF